MGVWVSWDTSPGPSRLCDPPPTSTRFWTIPCMLLLFCILQESLLIDRFYVFFIVHDIAYRNLLFVEKVVANLMPVKLCKQNHRTTNVTCLPYMVERLKIELQQSEKYEPHNRSRLFLRYHNTEEILSMARRQVFAFDRFFKSRQTGFFLSQILRNCFRQPRRERLRSVAVTPVPDSFLDPAPLCSASAASRSSPVSFPIARSFSFLLSIMIGIHRGC